MKCILIIDEEIHRNKVKKKDFKLTSYSNMKYNKKNGHAFQFPVLSFENIMSQDFMNELFNDLNIELTINGYQKNEFTKIIIEKKRVANIQFEWIFAYSWLFEKIRFITGDIGRGLLDSKELASLKFVRIFDNKNNDCYKYKGSFREVLQAVQSWQRKKWFEDLIMSQIQGADFDGDVINVLPLYKPYQLQKLNNQPLIPTSSSFMNFYPKIGIDNRLLSFLGNIKKE